MYLIRIFLHAYMILYDIRANTGSPTFMICNFVSTFLIGCMMASRTSLVQMGANMQYIDVGGGLAIDYDGSFTDTTASMSYTLQNYANDVVSAMQV